MYVFADSCFIMADSWGSGGDAFGSKMSLSELVDGLSAKKEVGLWKFLSVLVSL